jgi:hypothetical protein
VATLSVTASVSDGGTLSYQWYSNTINSNSSGTPVGTGAIYTPITTTVGTTYYYVVATNTNNGVNGATTATATSNTATVIVNDLGNAEIPTITVHPAGATYGYNETANALSVTASVSDGGTLSYQWYSNTINSNSGGTSLGSGAQASVYIPDTATVGTTYYYVVATNTNNDVNGTTTATATSNTAVVTVKAIVDAETPTITVHHQGGRTTNSRISGCLSRRTSVTAELSLMNGTVTRQTATAAEGMKETATLTLHTYS